MRLSGYYLRYLPLLVVILLNGCVTAKVSPESSSSELHGGFYYLKQCDHDLKKALLKIEGKGRPFMFCDMPYEEALPISVKLDYVTCNIPNVRRFSEYLQRELTIDNEESNILSIPNLLVSIATLTLIPYFACDHCTLHVELKSPPYLDKKLEITLTRWAALSGFLDSTKENYAPMAYCEIARIIADNLTERDYEQSLRMDWNSLNRKKLLLRDFCVVEMSSLWGTLLNLEASLKSGEADLEKARTNLIRLGRRPEMENSYNRMVQNHREHEKLLRQLYKKLEEAYLQSLEFDRYNSNAYQTAKRQQLIQNAEQDIRLLMKRFNVEE